MLYLSIAEASSLYNLTVQENELQKAQDLIESCIGTFIDNYSKAGKVTIINGTILNSTITFTGAYTTLVGNFTFQTVKLIFNDATTFFSDITSNTTTTLTLTKDSGKTVSTACKLIIEQKQKFPRLIDTYSDGVKVVKEIPEWLKRAIKYQYEWLQENDVATYRKSGENVNRANYSTNYSGKLAELTDNISPLALAILDEQGVTAYD
jgi:hypothetical protein